MENQAWDLGLRFPSWAPSGDEFTSLYPSFQLHKAGRETTTELKGVRFGGNASKDRTQGTVFSQLPALLPGPWFFLHKMKVGTPGL